MITIPIDIVNYICELASSNDKNWYPVFCPKTNKLSWKVNKNSRKLEQLAIDMFLTKISYEGHVTVFARNTWSDIENLPCKITVFEPKNNVTLLHEEIVLRKLSRLLNNNVEQEDETNLKEEEEVDNYNDTIIIYLEIETYKDWYKNKQWFKKEFTYRTMLKTGLDGVVREQTYLYVNDCIDSEIYDGLVGGVNIQLYSHNI